MKKYSIFGIILMIFITVIGCTRNVNIELESRVELTNSENDYAVTTEKDDISIHIFSESDNGTDIEITEEDIRRLVDENYYCITHIFAFAYLEFEYDEWINEAPVAVSDERFKTFQELEDYLRSVYVQEEVDYLLYEYWDGEPLYFEQDEVFMMKMVMNGGGMFCGWKDYTIEEINIEGNSCKFVILVQYSEEIDQTDRYVFQATYNEEWLLDEMVSKPQ